VLTRTGEASDTRTRTLTSAQGVRTWQTGHASAFRGDETGNTIDGSYDLTETTQEGSSERDTGGQLSSLVTAAGGTTHHEQGNEVTGAYQVLLHRQTQLVRRDETGPGGLTIHQTDQQAVTLTAT